MFTDPSVNIPARDLRRAWAQQLRQAHAVPVAIIESCATRAAQHRRLAAAARVDGKPEAAEAHEAVAASFDADATDVRATFPALDLADRLEVRARGVVPAPAA